MLSRPALETLLAKVDSKAARNAALVRAYLEHGYTLTEIGRAAEMRPLCSRATPMLAYARTTPMLATPMLDSDPYARSARRMSEKWPVDPDCFNLCVLCALCG